MRAFRILLLVTFASLINIGLAELNMHLRLPLFLDSIGTAAGAALLGPTWGVLIALLTQIGIELINGFSWMYAPWVVCSVATALIVGIAARRGFFSALHHVILVALLVSLANALLGAIVDVLIYGGFSGHATDMLVQGFQLITGRLFWAALWARVPINILDKGIAVGIAYGLLLFARNRSRCTGWR